MQSQLLRCGMANNTWELITSFVIICKELLHSLLHCCVKERVWKHPKHPTSFKCWALNTGSITKWFCFFTLWIQRFLLKVKTIVYTIFNKTLVRGFLTTSRVLPSDSSHTLLKLSLLHLLNQFCLCLPRNDGGNLTLLVFGGDQYGRKHRYSLDGGRKYCIVQLLDDDIWNWRSEYKKGEIILTIFCHFFPLELSGSKDQKYAIVSIVNMKDISFGLQ